MKKSRLFTFGCLIITTTISGSILSSFNASADDSITSNVHISVPVSCNLESTATGAHSASINNGTYRTDIGITTFKITCNDTGGYSVYAIGYANNELGNTKLLATIGGSPNSTYDIITGIGTNSTETGGVSNWAMKLTPVSGDYAPTIQSAPNTQGGANASFSNYHTVPSTYTKVATFPSITDTTTGSSFTSTYAAFIAANQPAGTYTGKVKYTMVYPASETPLQPHDATVGCISYWPNTGNVTDNMGDQCNLGNNTSVMLWPTNFSRPGYGFAGWSDQYDYQLGSNANTGHIYGPMETITTPSDMTTKGLSLYAVWVKSAGSLQNWNGCSSLASGAVTALTDQRDNNTYAVAKLADGKCWMIENLRLNNTATINNSNTNNPASGFTLSASQDPAQTTWCNTYSAACVDQSMLYTGNTTNTIANMTSAQQNIYSYGNYYNWYSATAGNGTSSLYSGTAAGDICPIYWRLPTGGSSGEATTLNTDANSGSTNTDSGLRAFPSNFVYSSMIHTSSVSNRGGTSDYWLSTTGSNLGAHNFSFSGSYVMVGVDNSARYQGRTIRCIYEGSQQ